MTPSPSSVDPGLARLDAAARLILRDVELARDAVQETLYPRLARRPGLRDPQRFDAWLHRLTVNACLDIARSRRRRLDRGRAHALSTPPRSPTSSGALADREAVDVGAPAPRSRTPSGRRAALPPGDADAPGGGVPGASPWARRSHGCITPSRQCAARRSPTRPGPRRRSPEGRSHDGRIPVRA